MITALKTLYIIQFILIFDENVIKIAYIFFFFLYETNVHEIGFIKLKLHANAWREFSFKIILNLKRLEKTLNLPLFLNRSNFFGF